jgi:EmrB/QacA subfamily drug resistance transporter
VLVRKGGRPTATDSWLPLSRRTLRLIMRRPDVLRALVIIVIGSVLYRQFFSAFTLAADSAHIGNLLLSSLFFGNAILVAGLQLPVSFAIRRTISSRWAESRIMAVGVGVFGLSLLGMTLTSAYSYALFFSVMAIFSLAETIYTPMVAVSVSGFNLGSSIEAFNLRQVAWTLGSVLGSFLGGDIYLVASRDGTLTLYWAIISGAALLSAGIFMRLDVALSMSTPGSHGDPRVRLALFGVMLAVLLAMLDTMIVGTAIPTIVRDIGGLNDVSWVVAAYTLATAISTPIWGKTGDIYGRKLLFLTAIITFLAGSALCGTAASMTELIGFRAVQGIGAGGLSTGAFAVIGQLVSPRERGRYQGMMASVVGLGTIGGPLVGGLITSHLGWRWAFYINIPIGIFTLAWCQWTLKLPASRSRARIDWLGITTLSVTISAVVLAATWGGTEYPWVSWQTGALLAGVVAGIAALIVSQRHVAEPVLPPRVFGNRNFCLAVTMAFQTGAAFYGAALYFPLFQQVVQGETATSSGLLLVPMMIPVVLMSQLAGKVMSRTGQYKIFPVLGAVFLTGGMLLWTTVSVSTPWTLTIGYMVLVGAGLGFLLQMTTTIAQNSVEMRDIGVASASVTLFRTLGGSLGVAVFGSLLTRSIGHRVPGAGPASAREAYLHAVASGVGQLSLAAAIICAPAIIAALLIKNVPLRGTITKSGPRP